MKSNLLKIMPILMALMIASCGAKGRSSSESIQPSDFSSTTSEPSSSSEPVSSSEISSSTIEHVHTPGAATEENRVEPTCTTDGGYDNVIRCTECHEIISSTHVTIDRLNHDFGQPTYEWNSDYTKCTATRVCSRNNEHIETETVNAVYSVIEPNSCGVEGSAKYTATFTNSAFAEQVHNVTLDALTHNYIETVVPATDDEEGYTLHKCEHCQDSYRTDITSAVNKFTYTEDVGGYRITGYNGEAEYFTVPASYNGSPIVNIDNVVFQQKAQVKEVILSEGILDQQGALFQDCPNLKKVVIPNSITQFKSKYLFCRCNALEEITIPFVGYGISANKNPLCTLFGGTYASDTSFVPASLKKVILGEACTIIPKGAFYKLTSLTSVIVGENVITIEDSAFSGATGITTLHLPKKVETINAEVFNEVNGHPQIASITVDPNNPYLSAEDGVLYNKDKTALIIYPSKKAGTEFAIPESVKLIREYAFNDCLNLTNITMSNNVEQLSSNSFAHCANITSITLSNKITEIPDQHCFGWCAKLETVNLPEGLIRIGNYAFSQCTNLASLTIPSTVRSIGAGAFASSLRTLVFAGSMRDITMDSNWSRNINNPQIICGGSNTPYGVQVNGGTPNLVSRFGIDDYHPEFIQFYVLLDHLKTGDTFTLYDAAKQEAWVATIEPYSFGGSPEAPVWSNYLDFDGTKYTLKQDLDSLAIFIKVGGTNCQVYMS